MSNLTWQSFLILKQNLKNQSVVEIKKKSGILGHGTEKLEWFYVHVVTRGVWFWCLNLYIIILV